MLQAITSLESCNLRSRTTNTPGGFHVETTWKRSFPRRFNMESTWCVCRQDSLTHSLSLHTFSTLSGHIARFGIPPCNNAISNMGKNLTLGVLVQWHDKYSATETLTHLNIIFEWSSKDPNQRECLHEISFRAKLNIFSSVVGQSILTVYMK